jgi:hypothetical protein
MPSGPEHDDRSPSTSGAGDWSVSSCRLTPRQQSDFLKRLGAEMRASYQGTLEEPIPAHLQRLLSRFGDNADGTVEDP